LDELKGYINDLSVGGIELKCRRMDLAYDVAPDDLDIQAVSCALKNGKFNTRVHRDQISHIEQYFGDEVTINLGSRTSNRYMRIYNQHGFVRFEMEVKGDAAWVLGLMMLAEDVLSDYAKVLGWAVGVLKDFISFDDEFWNIFDDFEKAGFKVSNFQADSMERSKKNVEEKMAVVLAALISVCGREWFEYQLNLAAFKAEDRVAEWGYKGKVSPVKDFIGVNCW